MQPLLLSHFIINLRETASPSGSSSLSPNLSRLQIATILPANVDSLVGNAGAMIGDPIDNELGSPAAGGADGSA